MNVSDAVKGQYKNNSIHKNLILRFPEMDLQIMHRDIHQDSVRLKESILDKESMEFVGCIASIYQVAVENLDVDVKGKKIEAAIYTDDEPEPIPLFHGIVDSAVKQANKKTKEIVAYDELYIKGNTEVAGWYKSLPFPVTLKSLRDSLFTYIGIEQVEIVLPNDDVQITKRYNPSSLQALSVIKAVCQINGAFGIINRNNRFEYRILTNIAGNNGSYPSAVLFPPFYPETQALYSNGVQAEAFSFYKNVDYEEYVVKPVDKLTIRQSEDEEGITFGEGGNNYIIQGNMFTYKLDKDVLIRIAERIYENVKGFSYYPFASENNGLPWVECGLDAVSFTMIDWEATEKAREEATENKENIVIYGQKDFYVLSRELSGIQALKDTYQAQGEEYQTEFITDLQTQIDTLKKSTKQEVEEKVEDYTYNKEEIDNIIATSGSKWDVQSVPVLPVTLAANTIYFIQIETMVE